MATSRTKKGYGNRRYGRGRYGHRLRPRLFALEPAGLLGAKWRSGDVTIEVPGTGVVTFDSLRALLASYPANRVVYL